MYINIFPKQSLLYWGSGGLRAGEGGSAEGSPSLGKQMFLAWVFSSSLNKMLLWHLNRGRALRETPHTLSQQDPT